MGNASANTSRPYESVEQNCLVLLRSILVGRHAWLYEKAEPNRAKDQEHPRALKNKTADLIFSQSTIATSALKVVEWMFQKGHTAMQVLKLLCRAYKEALEGLNSDMEKRVTEFTAVQPENEAVPVVQDVRASTSILLIIIRPGEEPTGRHAFRTT